MRCAACDVLLNDYDTSIKSDVTDKYLDLCGRCRASISEVVDIPDDLIEEEQEVIHYKEE